MVRIRRRSHDELFLGRRGVAAIPLTRCTLERSAGQHRLSAGLLDRDHRTAVALLFTENTLKAVIPLLAQGELIHRISDPAPLDHCSCREPRGCSCGGVDDEKHSY